MSARARERHRGSPHNPKTVARSSAAVFGTGWAWLLLIALTVVRSPPRCTASSCGTTTRTSRGLSCDRRRAWRGSRFEPGATQQDLPAAAHGLLGPAASVGRRRVRVSPRQRAAARDERGPALADPAPARGRWRVARGRHLRGASTAGRVGGVDFGTEEHAVADVPPRVPPRVPGLRSRPAQVSEYLWALVLFVLGLGLLTSRRSWQRCPV